MKTKNIIGTNIKMYREALGFNQETLAKYLDISREQISNYERGEREVSFGNLDKLANLFGIELEELLEEDEGIRNVNLAFAFRSEPSAEDLKEIAAFKKVVLNYIKIERLIND